MRFLSIIIISIVIVACQSKPVAYKRIQGEAQGTTFSVIYKDSLNRDFSDSLAKILMDFDDELSTYKSNSLISQFNRNELNFELESTDYFGYCFDKSIYWKKKTNGYFDPAIKHLIAYAQNHDSIPQELLKRNRDFLFVDGLLVKLDSLVELDFNAIAQGYSVDVLAEFLEKKGVTNYMVEIGGEMRLSGVNDKGDQWQIGLESPSSNIKQRDFQEVLTITNKSIATSGSYRKYKEVEGKRYSHAINPFTGVGVTHNLLSVTVISDKCIDADALATAFLVMGEEESLLWLKDNNTIDAYFISYNEGSYNANYTLGFKKYLNQ